jgi:predicted CXXCH cytochrome family protein
MIARAYFRTASTQEVRAWRIIALMAAVAVATSAAWAGAVEHPGNMTKDAECASCHTAKVTGKSVHSAMAAPCTVCHLTMTHGDMTMVSLSMPKERICSACHEESAALRQHVPAVKGACLECHDAHSSERKMLLLARTPASSAKK